MWRVLICRIFEHCMCNIARILYSLCRRIYKGGGASGMLLE